MGCFHIHKMVYLHHICPCPFKKSYTHVFGIVDLGKIDQDQFLISSRSVILFLKKLKFRWLAAMFFAYFCTQEKSLAFGLTPEKVAVLISPGVILFSMWLALQHKIILFGGKIFCKHPLIWWISSFVVAKKIEFTNT